MSAETPETQTNFEFKAEVQRVLSLVINSLYTNPEVFLRELISNASDALDKARFLQLSDDGVREQEGEAGIQISLDAENKTLCIEDNGVGMNRDEVIENLGTIARSGTSAFLEQFAELAKKEDKSTALELIGQFGVGFYAVFMVASRVDVHTLSMRKGSEPVLWRSTGEGSYSVLPGERDSAGTRIIIHLKEDAEEFCQPWRVRGVIEKYSDFVMFPISVDGEVANQSSALWRQARNKVTEEQHQEFFRHITHGRWGEKPQVTVHYSVDAPVQFSALLYIPEKAAPDLFMMQKERPGLRLYAKRVLIQENCESLTPMYLRFIRGVVDSEDLSLNVSRETLQEDRTVKQIEQQLTTQVLKALQNLSEEDGEKYEEFWRTFGAVLKEGISIDFKNKDKIAALCRFESLKQGAGKLISLKDYLDAKTEDQKQIYYITGSNRATAERSPHLEIFRKRDIDVLLLCDPIDEWVVQGLTEYEGCNLTSVVHGKLDFDDEDEPDTEDKDELDAAVAAIKSSLGDRVTEVRLSSRLTETASCLVSADGAPGAHLERMMKMIDEKSVAQKRILEVNPQHRFVKNVATLISRDPNSEHIGLYSEMLYDQALLSEGVVEDPAKLVARIQDLLVESSAHQIKD